VISAPNPRVSSIDTLYYLSSIETTFSPKVQKFVSPSAKSPTLKALGLFRTKHPLRLFPWPVNPK
jgi:hypothetical protein